MAATSRTGPLEVWLYGTRMARISETNDDRLELAWDDDAIARWGKGARLLSAKMPTGDRLISGIIKNYLDGLLPEGNARVNHAMSAGVPPDHTFGLIRAYGRDTPGAAIFVPEGTGDPTRTGRYEPLTLDEVADRLRRADEHSPVNDDGQTESSTLPGMVPKITLHRDGKRWYACKDGAASTWIVKRASGSGSGDVVDTEVACLALARTIGLTTISAELIEYDGVRAIAVSRYDRVDARPDPRLHQEDMAQAIGLNTQDPNRKFQWGSGMPSLKHGADVLRLDGGNPDELLRLATFSFLVGNTDMHAKNISFMRHADGRVTLSPAYDIAMHLHHDRDNRRSALDINGKFLINDLDINDLVEEGVSWKIPKRRAHNVVSSTLARLATALAEIDKNEHPGVSEKAWAVVEKRVKTATKVLSVSGGTSSGTAARKTATSSGTAAAAKRRGPRRPS